MSQPTQALAAPARSPASRPDRPFRVKLRGSILTIICLPNHRQIRAKLHQLSVTGGLMHLETPLDEKLKVELVFHLGETTIRERAEILFPMWATQGWLQPFRFLELPEASKKALELSLHSFIKTGGQDSAAATTPPAASSQAAPEPQSADPL